MRGWGARAAVIAMLVVIATAGIRAQSGGMTVRVVDGSTRKPLVGAEVRIEQDAGYLAPTVERTGDDGRVRFPVLTAVGGYRLLVQAEGFRPRSIPALRVTAGRDTEITIALLKQLEERVSVTSERPLIDLQQKRGSEVFSDEFIADLPVLGRSYQNLLTLAPGINDTDGDGNPNVLGARDRDFRVEVNGISNVDPLTGRRWGQVHFDSIESLEIVQTGAGVEFGRGDSFARIVQKQGSNEFEGVISMTYRTSKFDGDGTTTPGVASPDFEWIQPAIQLSGPIVKDRLWFRTSYERLIDEMPVVTSREFAISTRDQSLTDAQLTWQATPSDKLTLQYRNDPETIEGFGVDSRTLFEATPTLDRQAETFLWTWTRPVSPRMLIDTRLAYQRGRNETYPTDPNAIIDCDIAILDFRYERTSTCFEVNANQTSGPYNEIDDVLTRRYTARSQGTWALPGGKHQLKFGAVVEDERFDRDLRRGPTTVFRRDPPLPLVFGFPPFYPNLTGTVETTAHLPIVSDAGATGLSASLFLEEQFKPTPYATITVGVRLDREEISSRGTEPPPVVEEALEYQRRVEAILAESPFPDLSNLPRQVFTAYPDIQELIRQTEVALQANDITSLFVGSNLVQSSFYAKRLRRQDINLNNENVSLRLNAAWDPFKTGKTKVAASWGRYYNKIFLGVPLVELEPASLDVFFSVTKPRYQLPDPRAGQGVEFFPFQGPEPDNTLNPTVSTRYVDRNLRTPFQDEWSIRLEREIAPETSLRFTFLRRDFEDQFQDVDLNHQPGDFGICLGGAQALGLPVVEPAIAFDGLLVDPFTGEVYPDVPGDGDGREDDCTGLIAPGPSGIDIEQPDGRPDLYVLNPQWGEVLVVGNFNRSTYEAYILEVVRRMYRNWELIGSYTWSEALGNAEDFQQTLGNELFLNEDERGFLDFDQRHVVNVNVTRRTPLGFRFGARVRWESGLPYSLLDPTLVIFGRPPRYAGLGAVEGEFRGRYPTGQRNDQRNGSFWTVDLKLQREFQIGGTTVQVGAEVFNALDDAYVTTLDVTAGQPNRVSRFGRRWQLSTRVSF